MKKLYYLFVILLVLSASSAILAQNERKTIVGGVINGKAKELPKPVYPAAARAVCAIGTVSVRVIIDESGIVVSAVATDGHPLLRSASEQAAMKAKFGPTLLEGQPVKVSGSIAYVFQDSTNKACDGSTASAKENNSASTYLYGTDSPEEIDYFEIAAVFKMIQNLNADVRMDAVTNLLFTELKSEFASEDVPKELEFIKEFNTGTRESRDEILTKLYSLVIDVADSRNAKIMSIGVNIGELLAESLKRGAGLQTDVNQTKLVILKLRDLILLNEVSLDNKFVVKIKEIVDFNDKQNIDDPVRLSEIDITIYELRDLIFEDSDD